MAKNTSANTESTVVDSQPSQLETLLAKGKDIAQRDDVKHMAKGAALTVGAFFIIKGVLATAAG